MKFDFTLGNDLLEICNSYYYLGLMFTSTGKFKKCIEMLESKANRALYNILSFIKVSLNVNLKVVIP